MNLADYRRAAGDWLRENAPTDDYPEADGIARAKEFMAKLYDAGYSGITWPKQWGGQGLTQAEDRVFAEEARDYTLPTYIFSIGLGMTGPTIVDRGSDAQRERFVRPLLRGEEVWCQLFSEPGAGSDVASLQTRAVRDGDDWIVNGQKVWTSVAHHADWGLLLARTDVDVPKHKGLTMFVIDMHHPGVTVRPLKDMSGRANFNEIFFDNVTIPDEHRVGEVNDGWSVAVTTLLHERLSISAGVGMGGQKDHPASLEALRQALDTSDPLVRDELVELHVRSRALALFNQRLAQETRAGIFPGARGSAAKLLLAELTLYQADLATRLVGPEAALADHPLARAISMAPGMALGGGTNEIMRNIVGDRVLGLPPEPRVDKTVPFKDLKVGTQA
ncbi:alkylation response protein AidB-like acyl-CoA dehydrogenase [Nonomuraea thailandensis]|uniref:Alkylation response protein AidB-like acyl-CoA dehydrogenase n=1 Tax=Nonomuraea thailandensis TaxID=1188745 RepID=A0A9X2GHG2_9ACTN|nr:acyl-CoA dehydrogenase family protein [Nonomuraea thailandensis]MCP2354178.1 alkylation response protein AidB-like acyl-CoA dehydrogenase [Nonomuraea thailandensis]